MLILFLFLFNVPRNRTSIKHGGRVYIYGERVKNKEKILGFYGSFVFLLVLLELLGVVYKSNGFKFLIAKNTCNCVKACNCKLKFCTTTTYYTSLPAL